MPAVNLRRRASPVAPYNRNYQEVNGFYVHSSPPKGHYRLMADFDDLSDIYIHTFPPRVVQMNPSMIRQWLRGGEIDQLEQVVLEGKGHKLIGEYSPDPRVRNFIKSIPNYLAKITELHEAVNKGDLERLKNAMPTGDPTMKNIALCKDLTGAGLLHKAVYNDRMNIVRWLLDKYPETVKHKDREGKTPLHYCGASGDRENMWRTLVEAGADPNIFDSRGRTAAFYMERPGAIELPEPKIPSGTYKRFTSGKDGLVVKPSNIRIWIHDRDLGRLQQVLWEGHGNKLRTETSNNPRVKRFLDGIPYAMNAIKDVHAAVVNNDYEEFAKKTADPIPVHVLGSKDVNGLNPLHKAAGLGRQNMVEEILEKNPKLAFSTDHEGRTPLHYAAWLKNNDYIYTLLVDNGADEMAFDNNGKLPSYYKANAKEPLGKLLSVIPEAPRTSVSFPPSWDWALLQTSSARSTQNIPQLINHGMEPERKSVSDYDMNRLRPPDVLKPDFPIERVIKPVEEKIVKVEQKIFGEDVVKPVEIEEKPTEEVVETTKDEAVAEEETKETEPETIEVEKPSGEEESEAVEEEEEEREKDVKEVEMVMKEEPVEDNNATEIQSFEEHEQEVEKMEEDVEENKVEEEEEGMQEEGSNEAKVDEIQMEMNNSHEDEKAEEDGKEETVVEDKLDEESEREKTEREIAEERQRMLDEGLIKVADEEEEEVDEEIEEIIRNGDMQGLATLVLEGEGERLLGKKSDNSEIQGFLDNVPSYIAKIKAVHKAARAGELRDLQAALDRRRFAVAKDGSNSVGVTPLHAAVLFGRTPIVKYLGGRFPETLNAKDKKGRTPLHYAAALADNGHYFNILLNLGADRKIKDEAGNTPGYYLENPGRVTQEMLLQEFNAPAQIAREILSDKVEEDNVSSRRDLQDADCLAMLEECYQIVEAARKEGSDLPLARALTREVFDRMRMRITRNDKNLLDVIWPGVRALQAEAANSYEDLAGEEDEGATPPEMESYAAFEDLILPMVKNMHNMGGKIVLRDGTRIPARGRPATWVNPEDGGIIAPDVESYRVFEEVMMPVVKSIQGIQNVIAHPVACFSPREQVGIDVRKEGLLGRTKRKVGEVMKHFKNEVAPFESIRPGALKEKLSGLVPGTAEFDRRKTASPRTPVWKKSDVNITIVNPDDETVEVVIEDIGEEEDAWRVDNIDPSSKYVVSATVECTRNLEKYQFPGVLREEDLDVVEMKLRNALKYQSVIGAEKARASAREDKEEYYTMEDILYGSRVTAQLSARDLLIPLTGLGSEWRLIHGNHWPKYRGVHVSSDGNLAAWINVEDHLRIVACTASDSPGHVGEAYARIARLVTSLDKHLEPRISETLGYVTSRPSSLGNALRFQVVIRLPHLAREGRLLLSDFCQTENLTLLPTPESNFLFRVKNRRCLGLSEMESYRTFTDSITRLMQMEKDLAQERSKHVAGLIRGLLAVVRGRDKEVRLEQKAL